ncbi:TetR/AcrR family transcriptional regulator [Sorangium sp. So ce1151]|uniref:TetR/AcrR family transcriptional regulator n=1 Tax=Sorangium sp. So ce1151 TaxID=3133332 RepID=UPI003F6450E5
MRAKNCSDEQESRTFVESARRAQIVAAAIDTIAEVGYAQASFARIAQRAGLRSTGIISYHFAGKDELIREVLAAIQAAGAAVVVPRIDAETTAAGMLRAYITASIAFYRTHRRHMLALWSIWTNLRTDEDVRRRAHERVDAELAGLEELLRRGQREGEFRPFDVRVMALTLRQALHGVFLQLQDGEEGEVDARELVTLFDLATRRQP